MKDQKDIKSSQEGQIQAPRTIFTTESSTINVEKSGQVIASA